MSADLSADLSAERPRVAVLYQAGPAPPRDGGWKPMKPGGYRDSSADLAAALLRRRPAPAALEVVTPVASPRPTADLDWCFPDSVEGLRAARRAGAETVWANTVLYAGHPLEAALAEGLAVIGQEPAFVDRFDDKATTHRLLAEAGLPVVPFDVFDREQPDRPPRLGPPPWVVKPVRGRGSQGVSVVADRAALRDALRELAAHRSTDGLGDGGTAATQRPTYGSRALVEAYLPGVECTVAVLPPGRYRLGGETLDAERPWALPPVVRSGHVDGVVPYSGEVPVSANSRALDLASRTPALADLAAACERAAERLGARGVIRIDCRQDEVGGGRWHLFDVNLKPNLTGAGRPGREAEDSLVTLAARALGWSYEDLVAQLAAQAWRLADEPTT